MDLQTGKVKGVEALIRWNHPDLGLVSPMEFIPIAEDTGLIIPIGEWVIRTACQKCNGRKGSQMPIEANMKLLTQPKRPRYLAIASLTSLEARQVWDKYMWD